MALATRGGRRLLTVGYGIGVLLIALPLLDWVLTVWPLRPSTTVWRFGSVGLLSQALIQPIVGCALIAATAFGLAHRALLKVLAGLYLISVVFILGAVGIFALDSIEVRSLAQAQVQSQVEVTGLRVFVTYLAYAVLFGWLALGSWSVGKRQPGERVATDPVAARAKLIGG